MVISYIINNDVFALPTFNSLWKVLLGYATVRCTLASIIISVMGGSALCNLTCFDFSVEVNTWSVKPEATAPEAFWSKPLGVRKQWDESKATGARANSTKSDNGRRRRAYKRPELEENLTFNCDRLFTLFTFAPPKLRFFCRLWHLSWFFSKLFYTERAIICKNSCLISFCFFVQSSLVAKQTIITFGATNGGSITFNILRGQIDFSWTPINLWISREHFPTPFIFSSLKTFALHRKKTSDMEIFFSVSPALISNECQF